MGSSSLTSQSLRSRHRGLSEITEREYTKEQADAVKRILSYKSYYEVLSVERSASEDEIKRAYKKVRLCSGRLAKIASRAWRLTQLPAVVAWRPWLSWRSSFTRTRTRRRARTKLSSVRDKPTQARPPGDHAS